MSTIREVWGPNLEAEMRVIRDLLDTHPIIAMDTEFPGVVARPIGQFTPEDRIYQTLRCNVDMLKVIQAGITLISPDNELEPHTWQFNFRFNLAEDICHPDMAELLKSSGLDFQRHAEIGILPNDFAELLITSGLVLNDETTWIIFHGGYDFGYLLKLLTNAPLPPSESGFFDLLATWFPNLYDLKHMMMQSPALRGGLQDLADHLGVTRVGNPHQAGSDSQLSALCFLKIQEDLFEGSTPSHLNHVLYGFGRGVATINGQSGAQTAGERDDRTTAARQAAQQVQQQQQQGQGPPTSSSAPPQGLGSLRELTQTPGGQSGQMPMPMTPGAIAGQMGGSQYGLTNGPYGMRSMNR